MDEFKRLGLTGYETAVYTALLEHGRNDAKALSEYSKVPPTAVYPNLKSLIKKGLVQQLQGEVNMFEAVKPSIAIPSYLEKKAEEFSGIADGLIPKLDALMNSKEIVPKEQAVSLSYGSDASVEITKSFIYNTKKTLFILGWRFRSPGQGKLPADELKRLSRQRKDVRIIITGENPKYVELIKEFYRSGIKMKYYPIDNFSIIIKDAEECKITLKHTGTHERLNIHIKDKDFASSLNQYFISLWNKSQDIKKMLK
jgi:sugar-specific transcriptional regulator TrmB